MTSPIYENGTVTVYQGDCLDVLRAMPDASVHAIITDPPYGLSNLTPATVQNTVQCWFSGDRERVPNTSGFMGKAWDGFVPPPAVWDECLRVLAPGGHLLAFAGSRTHDLMTLAVRLAGFEIRDTVSWLYGSGFPKSLDVSKAIDRAAGAKRSPGVCGPYSSRRPRARVQAVNAYHDGVGDFGSSLITVPATDAAREWQGWGTALKPAHEPIVVARKPLAGTVAATVLEHGTGGLNIDACRIPTTDQWTATGTRSAPGTALSGSADGTLNVSVSSTHEGGRWPSNVVFTHAPDCGDHCTEGCPVSTLDTQSSNTSRFFPVFRYQAKAPRSERPRVNGIAHPTVKPLALMRWLIRLVTPPDGIVLDPFAGSGTTLQAARDEGFHAVGIERETDYIELIRARLNTNAEPDTEKHEPANEGKPESAGEIPGQVSLYDVLNEEGAA